jgi:hypothetical protein
VTHFPLPTRFSVVKPSNTTRTSTTTYAADPHLSLSLAAGRYHLLAVVYGIYRGAAGVKMKFTGTNLVTPPGLRCRIGQYSPVDTDAPNEPAILPILNPDLVVDGIPANGNDYPIRVGFEFDDVIELSAAGNIQLEWAQHTSDVNNVTIKAPSFIAATQVRT